jgi:hypothetical protein
MLHNSRNHTLSIIPVVNRQLNAPAHQKPVPLSAYRSLSELCLQRPCSIGGIVSFTGQFVQGFRTDLQGEIFLIQEFPQLFDL